MWEGGECWIIGGGPSIPREFGVPESVIDQVVKRQAPINTYSPYLSPIHGRHVIGVNAAFYIGTWIDIVFFGDYGFYSKNVKQLLEFPNLRVTCATKGRDKMAGVKFVARDGKQRFGISNKPNHVSWNINSGASAIGLAYHLGVKRIYLLGFDMKLGNDNIQHWHDHYKRGVRNLHPSKLPFHRHLEGFPKIVSDAKRLGLEIVNVCPDSAIEGFPKVRLKDVI
jgi:hypothetical protein